MKSKLKKRASIIIVLGIFFAISSIYYSNPFLKAVHKEKSTDYRDYFTLDRENLKISAVSGKIHIDNNWTAAKAAGICTGDGTYSDPYVIEDLVIDGGSSGSCILIEYSNVYFKIENCTVYNSGGNWDDAGILLRNTKNGQLIRNNCSSNYYGINLGNSNNNTLSGNTISNNDLSGIHLDYSNNNTLSGNTISNNRYGIYLEYSDNNTLSGNLMNFCGIFLEGSLVEVASHSIDDTNLVNNKPVYYYVNETGLESINFTYAGYAGQIILINCNNSIISGLNISDGSGISLYYCVNNTISGNTASNNYYGIILYYSDNNTLSGNTANNNTGGIYLRHSNNNTISGNTASNNYIGISLYYNSDNNTISGNTANDNSVGIVLYFSNNNTLSGNTANNNGYGIYLHDSHYNTVTQNMIKDNGFNDFGGGHGLYIVAGYDTSHGNSIYLNCFINNNENAFDDGSNNRWDNGTVGNYWSNYTGLDADGDGIGDVPHNITGSAGSQDNFPLMKCPLPVQDDNGGGIPIELIILISVISGGAVIGVVTLLLIIRKRKSI